VGLYDSMAPFYTRFRDLSHRRDRRKEHLMRHLAPFADELILDIGTGPGLYAMDVARKAPQSQVIGIDISASFVRIAAERARLAGVTNARFEVGDIQKLGFANDSFNKIICAGVLSVVDKRHQALSELARVLRPGGRLAVREPTRSDGPGVRLIDRLSEAPGIRRMVGGFGLMFGHFSPDFLTESELGGLFVSAGFSHFRTESCGRDLVVVATK
jgi:ubiquinone/menaquinone biosynthesis C-methylase UbiE